MTPLPSPVSPLSWIACRVLSHVPRSAPVDAAETRQFFSALFVFFLCLAMPGDALAQPLFFDDFEDRVRDQPRIGNNWTWFDQTFGTNDCTGELVAGFGPFDDGDSSDYEADNRNFWTASTDQGGDGNFYRAGLEVPAWTYIDNNGAAQGALSNMLRIYGNVFATAETCQRTLVFQERDIDAAGPYVFSFEVTQDQFGVPVNGEKTFAFVKVLRRSDNSFEEILFETVETTRVDSGARIFEQKIDFELTEDHVGELLQFGFFNDVTQSLGHTFATAGAYYDNVTLDNIGIGPGHSGTFFNASQDGHGFSIEFGEAGGAPVGVVYWYTYDDQGNNVFLIGVGTPDGDTLEVDFTSALGMAYGDFDPATVTRNSGGSGVFTFTSRDSAVFSYTPSDFTGTTFGHTSPVENLELNKLFPIPADDNFGDSQ